MNIGTTKNIEILSIAGVFYSYFSVNHFLKWIRKPKTQRKVRLKWFQNKIIFYDLTESLIFVPLFEETMLMDVEDFDKIL